MRGTSCPPRGEHVQVPHLMLASIQGQQWQKHAPLVSLHTRETQYERNSALLLGSQQPLRKDQKWRDPSVQMLSVPNLFRGNPVKMVV